MGEAQIIDQILNTSVSLAVLAVVLFGLYRLTHRVIDVLSLHIEKCCVSLDRIADALEKLSQREP